MTLSERNTLFKAGICLTSLCAAFSVFSSVKAFSIYSLFAELIEQEIRRPEGLFQFFIGRLFETNFYAVHLMLTAIVLYSCISVVLIYYFFEKTQAPEIIFVAFFAFSLSLEAVRFIIPLYLIYDIPPLNRLIAARFLLFGRFFGLFSLFTASVCASGLNIQRARNIIMVIIVATMIITFGASIDIQNWDTSFNMIKGYSSLFRLIETVVFFTTVISFFVAVSARYTRNYFYTGIGTVIALTGRNILLSSDTWAGAAGILFLSFGTWLICTSLHKIYLWR
jgi:hypothetical protein